MIALYDYNFRILSTDRRRGGSERGISGFTGRTAKRDHMTSSFPPCASLHVLDVVNLSVNTIVSACSRHVHGPCRVNYNDEEAQRLPEKE